MKNMQPLTKNGCFVDLDSLAKYGRDFLICGVHKLLGNSIGYSFKWIQDNTKLKLSRAHIHKILSQFEHSGLNEKKSVNKANKENINETIDENIIKKGINDYKFSLVKEQCGKFFI